MASTNPTRTKTQTLSLRLDPKTRFILEFMSRVRGQSITAVVERAIKEESERVRIGPEFDERGNNIHQAVWTDFWDPDEGVRTLKLLADKNYPTTYDEDEIRSFTLVHWEFFYNNASGDRPIRHFVSVLWPQIENYIRIWKETKVEDYWSAGKQMSDDLARAKLSAPEWPRKAKEAQVIAAKSFSRELDDEVPS